MPTEVTDPDLLNQLNGNGNEVTDPQLLAQLNATTEADPNYVPPDTNTMPLANNPFAGHGFWNNVLMGAGQGAYNLGTGAQELYARATGNQSELAALQARQASDRQLTAPLDATVGGKVGQGLGTAAATAPAMLIPGMQGVAGGALVGGITGALQPTATGQGLGTTALNTGTGAVGGSLGAAGGRVLGNWLTARAAEPLMGWTPGAASQTVAQATGSNAPALTRAAIGERAAELSSIFQQVRSPSITADLSTTPAAVDAISGDLSPSARQLFENNPNVQDLVNYATGAGTANGKQLGNLSTGLRQDASTALNSEGGNREVGLALGALKDHVDDTLGNSIPDPTLKAAYAAARPQYGLLQDVRFTPSLLNPATGKINATALGNYLQRNNTQYTAGADSPLFRAAEWGQASGEGKGPPRFTIDNFALPWLKYWATENPVSRAATGVASRAGAPWLPQTMRYGLPGLGANAANQLGGLFGQ